MYCTSMKHHKKNIVITNKKRWHFLLKEMDKTVNNTECDQCKQLWHLILMLSIKRKPHQFSKAYIIGIHMKRVSSVLEIGGLSTCFTLIGTILAESRNLPVLI